MYFPSQHFVIWKSKVETYIIFINNIIIVKDAKILC
jgi:hypothetical protein